jgi:hypothetical protein
MPGKSSMALAAVLGWPLLLTSFVGVVGFHQRLRNTRLLTVLVLCGLLAGSSLVMSGCSGGTSGGSGSSSMTPTGKFNVTLTVSGPSNTVQTLPIQFTVAAGVVGQE